MARLRAQPPVLLQPTEQFGEAALYLLAESPFHRHRERDR